MRTLNITERHVRGQINGCGGLEAGARKRVRADRIRGEVHRRALVPHMVNGPRRVGLHVQRGENRHLRATDLRGQLREVQREVAGNERRGAALHGSRDVVRVHHGTG